MIHVKPKISIFLEKKKHINLNKNINPIKVKLLATLFGTSDKNLISVQ